ncbi:MAG: hypothetical protein ABI690_12740 [Chloroflexota bacterium]
MNDTPPGTETFKTLSFTQRIMVVCIWVVYIGALIIFAPALSDLPVLFIGTVMGGAVVVFAFSYRIQQRASGGERIRINRRDGMRGEFSTRRAVYWMFFIVGFPLGIVGVGHFFTDPQTLLAGVVFTLVFIALFVAPVIYYLRSVNRLCVDEDGSLWFRRVWGSEWHPLRVSDFGRVEGRVTANRPHWRNWQTLRLVSSVWFRDPVEGSRSVYVAIEWVVSHHYRTAVAATVVENYCTEKCKQAGYVVDHTRRPNVAWTATPKHSRESQK